MSLIKAFVDAFKKATSSTSTVDTTELARSSGGSLGSTPQSSGGAFNPLRPAPEQDEPGLDPADVSTLGDETAAGPASSTVLTFQGDRLDPASSGELDVVGEGEFGGEVGTATGGAGAGKIKFNEFTIKKTTDRSSSDLGLASSDPEEGGEADVQAGEVGLSDISIGKQVEYASPTAQTEQGLDISLHGATTTLPAATVAPPGPEDDLSPGANAGIKDALDVESVPLDEADAPLGDAGRPNLEDFSFVKKVDHGSPSITAEPVEGGPIPVPYPNAPSDPNLAPEEADTGMLEHKDEIHVESFSWGSTQSAAGGPHFPGGVSVAAGDLNDAPAPDELVVIAQKVEGGRGEDILIGGTTAFDDAGAEPGKIEYPNIKLTLGEESADTGEFDLKADVGSPQAEKPGGGFDTHEVEKVSLTFDQIDVDDAGQGNESALDFLARKAGGKQEEYLTVKMEDVMVSSWSSGDAPADGSSKLPYIEQDLASVEEKVGAGEHYFKIELEEAFVGTVERTPRPDSFLEVEGIKAESKDEAPRDSLQVKGRGIEGESKDAEHKGEVEFRSGGDDGSDIAHKISPEQKAAFDLKEAMEQKAAYDIKVQSDQKLEEYQKWSTEQKASFDYKEQFESDALRADTTDSYKAGLIQKFSGGDVEGDVAAPAGASMVDEESSSTLADLTPSASVEQLEHSGGTFDAGDLDLDSDDLGELSELQ